MKCNLLTLEERRDLFLLKYAFVHLYKHDETRRQGRSWPLLPVSSCNTTFANNNINCRSIKLWNSLPRDWTIKDLKYNEFVEKCKVFLVKSRDNEFIYF